MRDVTRSRLQREEAQGLRRELAHAGRVTMLGQLATSLAHQLSQPLGAILRNTEAAELMLEAQILDRESLKEVVADIQRDDRRAGQVIDRLRALLMRRQMDFQPLELDELVQDVLMLVRATRHRVM